MVQILPQATNVGTDIGRSIGGALQQAMQQKAYDQYKQGRLEKAFSQLNPEGNFLEQLKAIAPALLSTEGGGQALGELSPLLARSAQQRAAIAAIDARRNKNQTNQNFAPNQFSAPGETPVSQTTDFRNPNAPISPETSYPERTAGPTTQPLMSPSQIEDYQRELMIQSEAQGQPMSPKDAYDTAIRTNEQIRLNNEQIMKEKERQQDAQDTLTKGILSRAENSKLLVNPEDRTLAGKFALEARKGANEEEKWEYVRSKMREFHNDRNSLLRNYTQPGLMEKAYDKIFGSYKDQETAEKQAQPYLDNFRKHGLFDESRKMLTNDIGLGPEDAERWLFPLDSKQKMELANFKKNPNATFISPLNENAIRTKFPGSESNLKPEQFSNFKEDMYNFLKKNKGVNLVSMRGAINQGGKYSWQDISRAVNELIDERRFSPDTVQDSQLAIIDNAPLPGLANTFDFLWKGTK